MKLWIILLVLLTACSSSNMLPPSSEEGVAWERQSIENVLMPELMDNEVFNKKSMTIASVDHVEKPTRKKDFICSNESKKHKVKSVSLDVSFIEADIREALIEISVLSDVPIVVDETVEGLVTANLSNVSLKNTLNMILAPGGYSFAAKSGYILVGGSAPDSPAFSLLAITCRYKPYHLLPIDLAASLTPYYQQFVRVPKMADYISITAPYEIQKKIQSNIKVFDRMPGQVLLEMSIVEVSREALSILGVNWNKFGKDPAAKTQRRLGLGEWESGVQEVKNIAASIMAPYRTLAESLQWLETQGHANVKAMPSIVSLDGREAKFSTTHTLWLPYSTNTTGKDRGNVLTYGVDINVIPRIANSGKVTLNIVKASVSDLTMEENGSPHIVAHEISNTVTVNNGEHLILGGLIQAREINKSNGIPKARKAPLIGWIFGKKESILKRTEVLIMIRPKILHSS